jgi:hypothetical protein
MQEAHSGYCRAEVRNETGLDQARNNIGILSG